MAEAQCSIFPVVADGFDEGVLGEYSMVELQGTLHGASSTLDGLKLGDIRFAADEPELTIGVYQLTGKVVKLQTPLLVLRREDGQVRGARARAEERQYEPRGRAPRARAALLTTCALARVSLPAVSRRRAQLATDAASFPASSDERQQQFVVAGVVRQKILFDARPTMLRVGMSSA